MNLHGLLDAVPVWMYSPFGYLIIMLFGIQLLAPRAWIVVEDVWWRATLGDSTVGQSLKRVAKKDFKDAIAQRVIDGSIPHPLAVLLTILTRPFELKRMTRELRGLKKERVGETFESAISQLNAGWREGKPPAILYGYIKTILDSAGDSAIKDVARLRGRSAASVVKYALGDFVGGNALGADNWKEAHSLESDGESEHKFVASYGYFYSTLFLGEFKTAMQLMAEQWSKYYAPLDEPARERLRERLSDRLILNPVLAIPRHFILAAAFNERPCFDPMYWPGRAVYDRLAVRERECKLRWALSWYEEAKRVCESEPTSLSLSHAYVGFYLTLLLLEQGAPAAELHERIDEAFDAIDDSSPIPVRYVKHGFRGVHYLTRNDDEKALESFSQAATFSAISGNRFARSLFACSHAVAAARLNRPDRYLEPDINHYLAEADLLAREIDRPFYRKLFYGAKSAVCLLRGEKAAARRFAAWSRQGETGNRILKIFYRDGEERLLDE
jgi:hypothetical protein